MALCPSCFAAPASSSAWGLDPALFLSVFAITFLAELPDKTAFAALILATRAHPVAIFIGAAVAFVIQTVPPSIEVYSMHPGRTVFPGIGAGNPTREPSDCPRTCRCPSAGDARAENTGYPRLLPDLRFAARKA